MLPQLSLFWRTFLLLCTLMGLGTAIGAQAMIKLEIMPRSLHALQQVAAAARTWQTALHQCANAPPCRAATMQALQEQGWRVLPRHADDRFELAPDGNLLVHLQGNIRQQLGRHSLLMRRVNDAPGLWVSVDAPGGQLWLGLPDMPWLKHSDWCIWLGWLGGSVLLALLCATLLSRWLQQPLRQLGQAVRRMDKDGFSDVSGYLDTQPDTLEIREVHSAFQHMAQNLEQREQERAIMLAGISHDLRTPLTRLRLETEMSVPDERARSHMIADMEQLNATIDKFLDYAIPQDSTDKHPANMRPVALCEALLDCMRTLPDSNQLRVSLKVSKRIHIVADPVDLVRIIQNLLENARRYGATRGTRVANIHIQAKTHKKWVLLNVRDHGPGVRPEHLPRLTQAFFRTETARTAAATGAGLGLAIVQKSMRRMGGTFSLANAKQGTGLVARLKFRRATGHDVNTA